ncbi:MAG TPA: arylsulfotransferase family protein [Polyangia bacterium]|nr:arylsulfotransferase family protein [Polyangia bacterium]
MHRTRPSRYNHWLRFALAAALCLGATLAQAHGSAPGVPLAATPGDLTPPPISVLTAKRGTARGLIFVAPKTPASPTQVQGPEIIDEQGRPIWFHAVGGGDQVADFRVQSYRGEPVLTWWQGRSHTGAGHGEGVDYIVDRRYRVIATVNAGNGLAADTHEFRLTPQGTALIVVYHAIPYDLSAVGGPAAGLVFDGVVQEIDLATGAVVFEWHSVDHVGVDESRAPVPVAAGASYDYFHINAVSVDLDGNLLIDARNTWAFYKVERRSGRVIWRLGGKKSDFTLGAGVPFAWQHDPEAVDHQTVRLFDNEAAPAVLPHSRVIWIRRDLFDHTTTLVRAIEHPDGLSAGSQGNSQVLDNGNTFVGWGQTGRFSEFDPSGNLLFDANVPAGYDTYRAYRHVWHARPDSPPAATAQRNADGTTTVHALWNGATDVARWIVVGGAHPHRPRRLGAAAWTGLDTSITIQGDVDGPVAVVAEDAFGRVIERSRAVVVSD